MLGQQPANHITLKFGAALWSFSPVAVADFINTRQMTANVVAETARQVVDALLFDQTIRGVVGKLVGCVVFVDQCGETNRLVVVVTNALAFGILAAAG